MTKYLIAKAIFDICYNLCNLFPLSNVFCLQCEYRFSYWYQVFYFGINLYLKPISLFLSIAFDFAATFDRYRLITDKCKFFNKIFVFKRGFPLIICIPFIAYTYKFGIFHITNQHLNNVTKHSIEGIGFSYTVTVSIDAIQKIIINFIFITLILILNLKMFIKLKKTLRSKRTIATPNNVLIQERINKSEARNAYLYAHLDKPSHNFPKLLVFYHEHFILALLCRTL